MYELEENDVASTVGHLYSSSEAGNLAGYLRQHAEIERDNPDGDDGALPCDLLIGAYARERKLKTFAAIPTLVEHTGIRSSLEWKQKEREGAPESKLYKYVKTSAWFEDDELASDFQINHERF